MNQITRNVTVLNDGYKEPIDYVRATNAIPIVFNFTDYTIPEGSTATVVCLKPSGMGTDDTADVSGNSVTITVKDQMFMELGKTELQVAITNGDSTLVTFSWPVMVKPNYTEGDFPPSQNESTFFEELQQAADNANTAADNANTAAESANQAAREATTAAQSANTAATTANEAAQNVDQAVAAAITPEALQNFVYSYFDAHPVAIAAPELIGTTVSFTNSIDPSAQLQQQVNALQEFANQFDGKTIYTT